MFFAFTIPELELSINNKCNLQCSECGFHIPYQPEPTFQNDILKEHCNSLNILLKNNIEIGSLAVLGGEPTLNPSLLENAVSKFSRFLNIKQIEVVTNGLNPKGFSAKTLELIQKISISVYKNDPEFIDAWKNFLDKKAPHINLAFRIQKLWDLNSGDYIVSEKEAQKLFDLCWYKKHCATIERSRLFICSVAPKNKIDSDGLLLTESTLKEEIIKYLERENPISCCKNCVPQMHIKKIQGGQQPEKIDLQKMMNRAKDYLNSAD